MMPIVDRKRDSRRRGSSALLLKTEKMTEEEVIVKLLKRSKEGKNTSSTIIDELQLLLIKHLFLPYICPAAGKLRQELKIDRGKHVLKLNIFERKITQLFNLAFVWYEESGRPGSEADKPCQIIPSFSICPILHIILESNPIIAD